MTYHPLANDTGQTPERRMEEAQDILKLIGSLTEEMNPNEAKFVEDMQEREFCSPKQLFWLRDLKEKYL